MKHLSIQEVAVAVKGEIIRNGSDPVITGVSTDTRTIEPGKLFVPLEGERFDGHDFLVQAAEKGAVAVLTHKLNKTLPEGVHTILVKDTLTALQKLSAWYLRLMNVPIVAVTGSTGKTTTKDMICSVLSEKYSVLKTKGNFNNQIGLPLTLFGLESYHQAAVLEMGMSGFGEISRLAAIAPPKVAVITNIGVSHIEKLGSRENILKAKSEIYDGFHEGCTLIINNDNDLLHREGNRLKQNGVPYSVVRFGIEADAEYRADDIQALGEAGIEYTLTIGREKYRIRLNVPGKHNVYNSLAAIAVGRTFGMDMPDIKAGLLKFASSEMRLNIFSLNPEADIKIIDDAYNSSPDSVKAALKILEEMDGKRKIAILGDMLEMGDYSREAHMSVGQAVAECRVDVLVTKGKDSAWIGEGAVRAGMNVNFICHEQSNQGVINWLKDNLQKGDRILVKGSRGMHMEKIVSFLKNRRDLE
ncbi:MAG TPA: UDP-N-acetylmuramoyl-tripeptide--D-alanyl-D-alanine ligase [Clostridiales bacterium]|nr:UDP-N-acetylmuramoyl-tripeptide--D-alanyl-D-alanine ligase [Clostridiales bacterium]